MADDKGIEKHGFVMYKSWAPMILAISDEDAGILFKAVCSFQTGQQVNIENPLLHGIFEMMKASFVQDDNRYREKCEKNARNGSKGGKAKAANATERKRPLPNANDCQKSVANLADIDKDIDKDMDIDIDSDIDKESDSDTETEMPADSSVPASVSVFSLSDDGIKRFADMCRKEHIEANYDDMEFYIEEMCQKEWKDAAGNKIRNIGGHFRDWLKRNKDDAEYFIIEKELYDYLLTKQTKLFETICRKMYDAEICICTCDPDAQSSDIHVHSLKELIQMLEDKGMADEAKKLKNSCGSSTAEIPEKVMRYILSYDFSEDEQVQEAREFIEGNSSAEIWFGDYDPEEDTEIGITKDELLEIAENLKETLKKKRASYDPLAGRRKRYDDIY